MPFRLKWYTLNPCKEIKKRDKENYIGKYKSQYNCIFGYNSSFSLYGLKGNCRNSDYKSMSGGTEYIKM